MVVGIGHVVFQLTAARRRLANLTGWNLSKTQFQLTAARRRLETGEPLIVYHGTVSTHSRPKAAGSKPWANKTCVTLFQLTAARRRLEVCYGCFKRQVEFQLTAARRRLGKPALPMPARKAFQLTAARRRLAHFNGGGTVTSFVSTHSRPKAAGASPLSPFSPLSVSTHSRPKAAGT